MKIPSAHNLNYNARVNKTPIKESQDLSQSNKGVTYDGYSGVYVLSSGKNL